MPAPSRMLGENEYRRTPRYLGRTLRMLRVVGREQDSDAVAKALGWDKPDELKEIEAVVADKWLTVHHVRRFQDYYGIPVSVIFAIGQTMAAAREKRDRNLESLGAMFAALARRLDSAPKRQDLIERVHNNWGEGLKESKPDDLELQDWDNALAMLVMEIWSSVSPAALRDWENRDRLKALKEDRSENPQGEPPQVGAVAPGPAPVRPTRNRR